MIVRVQGEREIQNHIYYEYDSESVPLGQGGMGIVYQGYCYNALTPEEYIPVAIKSIQNPTQNLIDRAMREASIQIDHPNLLRMYGFIPNMEKDEYSQSYRPKYYLVMESLPVPPMEGLQGRFATASRLSVKRVVSMPSLAAASAASIPA